MDRKTYNLKLAAIDIILKKVKEVEPLAYVGGGALRDLSCDRPIKDIDIFVPERTDLDKLGALFSDTHSVAKVTKSSDYFDFADPTVKEAREYAPIEHGLPINFISMKDSHFPMSINMGRFDFGICRIAYDGLVHPTPEFIHDLDNQVFTLRRCENQEQFERSMARYERLKRKYNWPLVVPEEFGQYV